MAGLAFRSARARSARKASRSIPSSPTTVALGGVVPTSGSVVVTATSADAVDDVVAVVDDVDGEHNDAESGASS